MALAGAPSSRIFTWQPQACIVKLRQLVFVAARPTRGAFEMLEPCEGRLSRTVLRGLGGSNAPWLPDRAGLDRR